MTIPRHQAVAAARWLDTEASDLVRDFWSDAGGFEPFPRNLERALAIALPVSLTRLANLHLHHAERWLQARGVFIRFGGVEGGERAVHGCILARAGHGFLFVDGSDSDADLRFTIAHEIGHFLAEHVLPRRRAVTRFGTGIIDVLDGRRAPTASERLQSGMAGLQLADVRSFLPRGESAEGGMELWRVEGTADRIGAALLAPPDLVLAAAAGRSWDERLGRAQSALVGRFGFPDKPALRYAETLLSENSLGPSWAESMRNAMRS